LRYKIKSGPIYSSRAVVKHTKKVSLQWTCNISTQQRNKIHQIIIMVVVGEVVVQYWQLHHQQ
jgi:hypothetical protein